jgi:hypothetical protein
VDGGVDLDLLLCAGRHCHGSDTWALQELEAAERDVACRSRLAVEAAPPWLLSLLTRVGGVHPEKVRYDSEAEIIG